MLKYPTLDSALKELKKIGLDVVFQSFWDGRFPESFYVHYHEPRWFFSGTRIAPGSRISQCVPLIEDMDSEIAYDPENGEFVEYYYEDMRDCRTIGKTYQQMLSWLLYGFVDAGMWDEIEDVVPHFGYKYLPELKAFVEIDSRDSYLEQRRRFVASTP